MPASSPCRIVSILWGRRVNSCISRCGRVGGELAAHLAEIKRNQQQRGQLAGESFGGGHADFRAGMGEDACRRLRA